MLLAASSLAGREGILWRAHQRHHGKDGPVFSWRAPTLTMYPGHPRAPIDALYAEDPVFAASEYSADFRDRSSVLTNRDALEAVTSSGVLERPPVPGQRYFGFVDAADGAKGGGDSMCLAIAHRDDRTIVLDLIREAQPPFSPEKVVADFARVLKTYRTSAVQADLHARGVLEELFRSRGIRYEATAPPKAICSSPASRMAPGVERAKADGVYRGGKRRLDRKETSMNAAGLGPAAIAAALGCSRMQV